MGQVWVRLPVAVGAEWPRGQEAAPANSKEEAATGGAEWGQCGLWGSAPGWWKWDGLGSVWGGCGLSLASLSMQDSDGDKSDDLVVDVSNEVRAVPGRRAALCVGSWRWFLSRVGAVVSRLLHHLSAAPAGFEAFGWETPGWSGGGRQGLAAWWLGSRSHRWVPRMRLQRERERDL